MGATMSDAPIEQHKFDASMLRGLAPADSVAAEVVDAPEPEAALSKAPKSEHHERVDQLTARWDSYLETNAHLLSEFNRNLLTSIRDGVTNDLTHAANLLAVLKEGTGSANELLSHVREVSAVSGAVIRYDQSLSKVYGGKQALPEGVDDILREGKSLGAAFQRELRSHRPALEARAEVEGLQERKDGYCKKFSELLEQRLIDEPMRDALVAAVNAVQPKSGSFDGAAFTALYSHIGKNMGSDRTLAAQAQHLSYELRAWARETVKKDEPVAVAEPAPAPKPFVGNYRDLKEYIGAHVSMRTAEDATGYYMIINSLQSHSDRAFILGSKSVGPAAVKFLVAEKGRSYGSETAAEYAYRVASEALGHMNSEHSIFERDNRTLNPLSMTWNYLRANAEVCAASNVLLGEVDLGWVDEANLDNVRKK